MLIRVITTFDRIVDLTGVYKVSNVADLYMCCGGCPQQVEDHVVRVAKMALAMMEAVQACGWRWSDGTPVALQIGIHTGPVIAGVVGCKTYTFNIFGDSVNTGSVCSGYVTDIMICYNTPILMISRYLLLFTIHLHHSQLHV